MTNAKPSMLVVFLTVFIDLVGFGIVVPLVPLYSRHFGASGWQIGVVIASYSAMQFVFSPIWGRLSDRHGRRPILLVSTAGAAASYVLFALASDFANHGLGLGALLFSRIVAGACGGNITVAQAYIADITPPQDRAKRMGLIGMAFGLGFIFGPAISGVALKLGGATAPGWAAAGLCAANFALAYSILAESLNRDSTPVRARPHLEQWLHTLSQPRIGLLVLIFFLATFAFSCFESTLPLLVSDNFDLGIAADATRPATTVVSLFVFCGVIAAVVQGGAIGSLVKMLGEPRLVALSLLLTGVALALLPFIKGEGPLAWSAVLRASNGPWIAMLLALALLSVGRAHARAALRAALQPGAPHGAGRDDRCRAKRGLARAHRRAALRRLALLPAPALPYVVCGAISIAAAAVATRRLAPARR